ncbi:MAG TPA: VOC family protein [Acidobacteriaceae bacterium]|jgi:methylmalonyl-CoA/ethylmalonyl-CoA epimerase|nr:VOC family protein [Acidobacteriaceae bacterium]
MEDAVHLDEIAQVALTVTNLKEAKVFYREVLGMRFLFEAGTMAFFQCGSVRLMIGTAEAADASRQPFGTILYFRVADLEATRATLKSNAVAMVQEPRLVARMRSHDLWMAFIEDPAGNTLGLMSEMIRPDSLG